MIFFFTVVNMGPYGSKLFQALLLLHIAFDSYSWFLFLVVLTKVLIWIFESLNFEFVMLFFRKFHVHHCNIYGNWKPQLTQKGACVERNVVKFGPREQIFSVHKVLLTIKYSRSICQLCTSKTAGRRAKRTTDLGLEGKYLVCTGYFWQLSVQCQSEVIRCIFNFPWSSR